MIHCSQARSDSLLPLAALLPGTSATLFDLPGHGRSGDWDGRGDFQAVSAAIAAALCTGPTHLVGHSFGATVALRLACDQPALVSRLTLIEPVFFAAARGSAAWQDWQAAIAPFGALIRAGDMAGAAGLFHGLWGQRDWDSLPDGARASLTARIHLIAAGAPAIEDDNAGLLASGALTRLICPVTLIRGAGSPPVIGAIHRALCSLIPQARDHVVAGAGHMSPLTHPADVAAVIQADAT